MRKAFLAGFCALTLAAGKTVAAEAPLPAAEGPPKLFVALAVDQLSADLFAEYRGRFTGGFARLLNGRVFPSGYQAHAMTETCPGHSTILTGAHPARTGIIANTWSDPRAKRDDKTIYCVEDETVEGSSSTKTTISLVHMKVPTLGDRLKAVTPETRVVAVAGKDRAAATMAGHTADETWWWRTDQFQSYAGRKMPPAISTANKAVKDRLAAARPASDLPEVCNAYDKDVVISPSLTVGRGRFARPAGDTAYYPASPDADMTVLDTALALAKEMKLGQGKATDVLAVGLSATDYVGHYYGTGGAEMCIHLLAIDRALGEFFEGLDTMGVDYAVVLTADHGGHDIPERSKDRGVADGTRIDGSLAAARIGKALADELKLSGPVLYGDALGLGDFWIDPKLTDAQRDTVLKRAVTIYKAHPHVQAVFTRAEIMAAPAPKTPPDEWSLIERAKASYHPERSGDFVIILKPRVMPALQSAKPYTTMHGTAWDYDRRVPIVFWRNGMTRFEQPLAVETVDILPTLAAMVGLKIPAGEIDGHCLFGCEAP
jgi:predicted AlkP superfamily pyrophosphatase or phosphodiesterase